MDLKAQHDEDVQFGAFKEIAAREVEDHYTKGAPRVPTTPPEDMDLLDTGSVAFRKRSIDLMHWDEISKSLPGGQTNGRKMGKLVGKMLDALLTLPIEQQLAALPVFSEFQSNIFKIVGAVRAKQAEKPVQMNNQFNIDTGGVRVNGRPEGRRVLRQIQSPAQAKIGPASQSGTDASGQATTSRPSAEAGDRQAVS